MTTVSMHISDSRKFRFAIVMLAMVALSMHLIGCASENNNGIALPPDGSSVLPPQTCQVNQIYTSTHGCLNQQSCQNGYGWVPAEGRCVPGSIANSASGTPFITSLQITSSSTFALLLQNARMCDPFIIGVNLGNASCKNYSHAGYLAIQFPGLLSGAALPNQATVWVGAGAPGPGQSNSGGSWTTFGTLERSFLANIGPANDNLGFTGTPAANGVANNLPGGFRFIVNNGLPGNSYQMNVDLQYNGETFAKGVLTRY